MAQIEARELTDEELTTTLETLGDTPTLGVFVDDRLVAVGVRYSPMDKMIPEVIKGLIVRDDTVGLEVER
jgi:plasmid stabilization system protein ParE